MGSAAPKEVAEELLARVQRLLTALSGPQAVAHPSGLDAASGGTAIAVSGVVVVTLLTGIYVTISAEGDLGARLALSWALPALLNDTLGGTTIW